MTVKKTKPIALPNVVSQSGRNDRPEPTLLNSLDSWQGSDRVHLVVITASRLERAFYLALIVLCAFVLVLKTAAADLALAFLWFIWGLLSWFGWRQLLQSSNEVWRYHGQRGFDSAVQGKLEVQGLWELRPYFMLIRYRAKGTWRRRLLWPDSAPLDSLKILSGTLFSH